MLTLNSISVVLSAMLRHCDIKEAYVYGSDASGEQTP